MIELFEFVNDFVLSGLFIWVCNFDGDVYNIVSGFVIVFLLFVVVIVVVIILFM